MHIDEEFYEYSPPPPERQHKRLVALRELTARGIPCILWGEDTLCYVYRVATVLFAQKILVPDELLQQAAAVLQEGRYVPTGPGRDFSDSQGVHAFPNYVRLRHLDIPEDAPYTLDPLPGHILLLPQSYYDLDVRAQDRFQSLVPPLPISNKGILVPKFHTFIEALVHFVVNPPTDRPNRKGRSMHTIFIGYLASWRVQYDASLTPPHMLLPEEQKILDELCTDEARWYMHQLFWERRPVNSNDVIQYKQALTRNTVNSRSDQRA
ncbi:hypothetical protein BDW22DRAFT_873487 [Trametopsis cervina]|nr:hypothetical protein BDW22DRAFT_873487 [Trametopsis cervina]